jgi:hypothetical protein
MSAATNTHATMEELLLVMFSVQSVLRLYSEDQWEKSVSESEVRPRDESCMPSEGHYRAITSEDCNRLRVCTIVIGRRIREVELLQLESVRITNLSVHQDGRCSSTGILEILDTEARIAEI